MGTRSPGGRGRGTDGCCRGRLAVKLWFCHRPSLGKTRGKTSFVIPWSKTDMKTLKNHHVATQAPSRVPAESENRCKTIKNQHVCDLESESTLNRVESSPINHCKASEKSTILTKRFCRDPESLHRVSRAS